jgi:hypothetical protein
LLQYSQHNIANKSLDAIENAAMMVLEGKRKNLFSRDYPVQDIPHPVTVKQHRICFVISLLMCNSTLRRPLSRICGAA